MGHQLPLLPLRPPKTFRRITVPLRPPRCILSIPIRKERPSQWEWEVHTAPLLLSDLQFILQRTQWQRPTNNISSISNNSSNSINNNSSSSSSLNHSSHRAGRNLIRIRCKLRIRCLHNILCLNQLHSRTRLNSRSRKCPLFTSSNSNNLLLLSCIVRRITGTCAIIFVL